MREKKSTFEVASQNQENPVGQFQEHLNSSKGAPARGHALAIPASCSLAGRIFSNARFKVFSAGPETMDVHNSCSIHRQDC